MLDIHDLQVGLDSDAGLVRAVDGLRLSLERGQTFALVGESGCGKSMTALALMRLLPDNGRVLGGRVDLDGTDTLGLSEQAMRAVRGRRVGMIFQEPGTSLNPVLTVGDQIVEAIETHTALRGDAARARAVDWLRRVGIPEPDRRMAEYPFRMSGGQKQRVMIAMTLATEPDYLVADEPTTALDVTIQRQILDLLRELQAEHGLGLLLITHDLAVVAGMAQHVALMYAGQVVEVATTDEFFRAPRHPYAQALLRALPDARRRNEPLAAIAGTVPPLTGHYAGCRFADRCGDALPQCAGTVPPMVPVTATHGVRCLLHAPGTTGATLRTSPAARDAPHVDGAALEAGSSRAPRPAPEGEALLDVQDLRVRFVVRQGLWQRAAGHFDAVDGVSFRIGAGRTLALVGESGCGKTTTGKAVVQLLRGQAQLQGRALLDGRDLFAMDRAQLLAARRDVQIIFQDPFSSLDPRMRVFDILEEGLLALRPELDAPARRQRLEGLADQVGLRREALERYPHEFSGGQRQRIAIARALAVQPRLIVCDEPTSALDVSVQAQILNLLRQLQRDLGVAYLFITHNIGVVEYIADEVAVMRSGRLVEAGDAGNVLGHPAQDYTRQLLAAVPRLAVAV